MALIYICPLFDSPALSWLIYHLFRWTYPLLLRIASPFHPKARAWVRGRKGIFQKLEPLRGQGPFIWVHCASLGEFEQGRPVMEGLRIQYPNHKILLTFFSPSGYQHQQHYSGADWVFYLPMDGPQNAKRFLDIVDPVLVIFVKYEFWFYYLKKLHYRKTPLLLISASFRPEMSFFRWYGALSRKMLTRFDRIFVQDTQSQQLLANVGLTETVEVSGDTRFDRVAEIAKQIQPLTAIESFLQGDPAIVVGSSWPADEQMWSETWTQLNDWGMRLLIVPHEVDPPHIQQLQQLFPDSVLYSTCAEGLKSAARVLIVDRMGLLALLYRYGWVNYVGGGLNPNGVHNVLEAAVYDRPVITGPRIEKYREAVELAERKGLYALPPELTATALVDLLTTWRSDPEQTHSIGKVAGNYVREHTGAVRRILNYVQANRLLIS